MFPWVWAGNRLWEGQMRNGSTDAWGEQGGARGAGPEGGQGAGL